MNREDGVLETLKNRQGRFNWYPVSTGARKWMYREFNRWLLVEAVVAGIEVWQTRTQDETVQTLIDLHALGEKEWTEHKTVHDHSRVTVDQLRYRELPDGSRRLSYRRPKLVERIAVQFDGLGVERAIAVGEHFKTAEEMGKKWMEEKEWRRIPGIGKGLSRKIVEALRGEE
jgi:NAD-dependent DNA ligase